MIIARWLAWPTLCISLMLGPVMAAEEPPLDDPAASEQSLDEPSSDDTPMDAQALGTLRACLTRSSSHTIVSRSIILSKTFVRVLDPVCRAGSHTRLKIM